MPTNVIEEAGELVVEATKKELVFSTEQWNK